MRVAVTGSSGLIGTPLAARLEADGHDVVRVVRRPVSEGESALRWDPAAGTIDAAALAGVDAVVNLAGPGIGDKRWTEERKRELRREPHPWHRAAGQDPRLARPAARQCW